MSTIRYKVPTLRGASSVAHWDDGRRLVSSDGSRWAISRNRKRSLGNGRFDVVEAWTLKERVNGRAVTVDSDRFEADAVAWVKG